ncbi:MAG: class I tRNA ligase family protein, partial [Clostridia bacterium]|nr:class I tRNA ligase family protein [Clostridia bacterium]
SPVKEPFKKLVHQGMILGENGIKMGKRFPKYVVNPSDIVNEYGADTLRLYEMFMGPLEVSKPWSSTAVAGARKFINRVWNFFANPEHITETDDGKLTKLYHQTVRKVTKDFETLGFNTAIAQMMVFVNEVYKVGTCPREYAEGFVKMISCITPHVGEELWQQLGHTETIAYEPWPVWSEEKCKEAEVEIAIQICGKVRGRIMIPADLTKEKAEAELPNHPDVIRLLGGKTIVKIIFVPGRLLNIVAK